MKSFRTADEQSSAESTQSLNEFFRDLKCYYPRSPFSSQSHSLHVAAQVPAAKATRQVLKSVKTKV